MNKKFYAFFIVIVFAFNFNSKACSPLNVPTLVSYTVTPTALLIDWKSTTVYYCPDVIDVEIVASGYAYTGLASNTFTSSIMTGTAVPYYYPTMSIPISSFCTGSVYQFRARERNNGSTTSSAWTASFTFTTLSTAIPPSLAMAANPNTITQCPQGTSALTNTVVNNCGNPPYNYTWTPSTGLSCTNCPNPLATPSITTIYTLTANGGPLGGWVATNTVQVTVTLCTGLTQLSAETIHLDIVPNPNNGQFVVNGNTSDNFDLFVYNNLGQLILSIPKCKNGTAVDLSRFGKGIYSISLQSDGRFKHSKLVIE